MKSLMLMLGGMIIILFMGTTASAIQSFRSESHTEAHASVTTAAGVTSANVTLTQALFGDRTSEVNSVTSSNTADVPLVSTYTSASKRLLISGLAASDNRTLTIDYQIGRLDDFYAADLAARAWMMFLVLGVIGVIAASVYVATRRD